MSFSLRRPELLALPLNIHRISVMGEPANWETRQSTVMSLTNRHKFETRDSRDAGGPLVLPRARCLVLVRSWPAGGMRRYAAAETLTGLFAGITSFASRGKENRFGFVYLYTLFAELIPYELSLHHRDKKRYPVVRDCKK
ncbi:hypothetical protein V1478_012195 [Vespula squamosa]|uniref:Uncharacterized protein n=1 Tax=Vespula squamosa TaxID=30214 RepID=A0ABD2ACH5_VESSQ